MKHPRHAITQTIIIIGQVENSADESAKRVHQEDQRQRSREPPANLCPNESPPPTNSRVTRQRHQARQKHHKCASIAGEIEMPSQRKNPTHDVEVTASQQPTGCKTEPADLLMKSLCNPKLLAMG